METNFDFYSHDPKAINEHLDSGKAVCLVLNKDLAPQSIGQGAGYGYVMLANYLGEERLVVVHGCYKKPVKRFDRPDPEVLRKCKKSEKMMEGVYPARLFKTFLEDPLCLVINNSVSAEQLEMLLRGYETFEIKHEGETHKAIACVYFNPHYKTDGKIIGQWYS